MEISTVDIIIAGIILGFGLFGFWFGFVSTIGSIIGTVLGLFLAIRFYSPLAAWLMELTGWTGNFPKIVMFIVAFLLINRLVGLAFFLLGKGVSVITDLPIIKSFDRILGLMFGLFEGILVIGICFYFIDKIPFSSTLMNRIGESSIIPYSVQVASFLWPLIPEGFKKIQSSSFGFIKI